MRILFLALDINLARQRGDTVHVIELAAAFSRLGHDVALVVGSAPKVPILLPKEVSVATVRGADLQVLAAVRRIANRFSPQITYERRTTPKIGFALRTLSRLPVVMELNGVLRDELLFQGREVESSMQARAKKRLRGIMLRRLDAFVAVSNAAKEDLVQTYGVSEARIRVIGNGVNLERFRPLRKGESSAATGLEDHRPRAVFIGNLVAWRDLKGMIDAFSLVLRHIPEAQLVVVGEGPERSQVEEWARSSLPRGSFLFPGEIPYDRVPHWIGAADVGMLPEHVRTVDISPIKLFEYLASARPVVAFDVAGLAFLRSLDLGRLVPPGDIPSFGQALAELLSDSDLRSQMGMRGREYVERERSWESVAMSVVRVMDGTLGRAR